MSRELTGTRAITLSGTRALTPPMDGYVGPLDSVTVAASYSLRLLDSAYGGALIRLRRSSDDAESDFSAVAETGIIDTAAIATWLGASDGLLMTWYDQSGNGRNVVQAIDAKQLKYIADHNGKPAFLSDGADDFTQFTGVNLPQPYEMAIVTQPTAQNSGRLFDSADTAKRGTCWVGTSGEVWSYGGTSSFSGVADIVDTNTHYVLTQFNGASSVLRIDGGEDATGDTSAEDLGGWTVGSRWDGAFNHTGYTYEFILKASLLSAGERSALEANEDTYYGVS